LSNVKGNRSTPSLPARVTCPHSSALVGAVVQVLMRVTFPPTAEALLRDHCKQLEASIAADQHHGTAADTTFARSVELS
jgi:hypothetical protein